MAFLTQREWARRQGFSVQYVTKLIAQGKIKLVNGRIDEDAANLALAKQRDPNQPLQRKNKSSYSSADNSEEIHNLLMKMKLKNEIERGKLLEAKVKEELAELLPAEKVYNAMFAKGRIIRDGILNIPDRISSLLAGINDPSRIHEILTKEFRAVLEELSRDDEL